MVKDVIFKIYNYLINTAFSEPRNYKVMSGPIKDTFICLAPRHGIKKILGSYEPEIVNLMTQKIGVGDACIDVGAHVGYITMVMRKLVGVEGEVYAFEPIKENCECIERSVVKNNYKNVTVLNYGLGEKNQEMSAHVFNDSNMVNFSDSGFKNYSDDKNSDTFIVKTLDSVDEIVGLQRLNFIKIDAEGYESKIIEGARGVLQRFGPKLLIEVHNADNFNKLKTLLPEIGYSLFDLHGVQIKSDASFEGIIHILATK